MPEILLPNELVGFKIRKLHNRLSKQWGQLTDERGLKLSAVQAGILMFIRAYSGLTQKDLAGLLKVDASTMSQALLPLLERKLIMKMQHPGDRRKFKMILSEEGTNMLGDISYVFKQRQEDLPGDLTQDEIKTLHRLLDKMIS